MVSSESKHVVNKWESQSATYYHVN